MWGLFYSFQLVVRNTPPQNLFLNLNLFVIEFGYLNPFLAHPILIHSSFAWTTLTLFHPLSLSPSLTCKTYNQSWFYSKQFSFFSVRVYLPTYAPPVINLINASTTLGRKDAGITKTQMWRNCGVNRTKITKKRGWDWPIKNDVIL